MSEHTSVAHEVILVDNASTECDPSLFADRFPFIKLIRNSKNTGFANGNNLGIQQAKGDLILLLNSDTFLTDDAISKTVAFLEAQKNCGAVGCRMVYPDGNIQYTARRFRSIGWELWDLFRPLLFLFPYKARAKKMLGKYFKADFNTSCNWLNGAFLMFRKELILQLPGQKLDERFFMYGEDHLWCWQFEQLGFTNYFYCGATIVHISSGSTSLQKQLNLRTTMMQHELEIMKLRKGPGFYYTVFRFIYTAKEQVRNLVKRVVFRFSGKLIR